MFNIIRIVEEAAAEITRSVKDLEFHDGHLAAHAKINVGGTVYDAVLTIDEEVPETPLSDG